MNEEISTQEKKEFTPAVITEQTLFRFLSADGKTTVTGYHFPVENPKAVIQLSHGMIDHSGHYLNLIGELNRAGYAVVSNDHLGHGLTAAKPEDFGYFGVRGAREFVVSDLHTVTGKAKEWYPNTPVVLIGHSMGSFLARMYAARFGNDLSGLVILGTGGPNPALPAGKLLADIVTLFCGRHHRSRLIAGMAFSGYLSRCEKGCPKTAWITRDIEVLKRYRADPLSNYVFTVSGYRELFGMVGEVNSKKWGKKVPRSLPILVSSGSEDPVGGFGKGVRKAVGYLEAAGVRNLTLKLYEGDRHELHAELNSDVFFSDLISWLGNNIG